MPGATDLIHQNPRIRQFDIRDVDGSIIPPWAMAEKLTPGTMVRVVVVPNCFIFNNAKSVDKVCSSVTCMRVLSTVLMTI